MFSSSNPFPSSTHGFPPTSGIFFGQEKDGVNYFNHYPFFTGAACCFDPPPPPTKESSGLIQNSDNNLNLSDSLISPSRKRVAASSKKDRHSKIFTAHGPRDRRVRLSIDISKKFFGLQDLLGFDKASKTLDWLFSKSKTAITDLVEEMKHTSSSTLSNQCEQVFMEKGDYLEKKGKKKKPVANKCVKKKKKITQKQKSGFHVNLGARNQLRAEARARARERTKEKMLVKKTLVVPDSCESGCWGQIELRNIDYEDNRWEGIMDQETSMQSKDSSF